MARERIKSVRVSAGKLVEQDTHPEDYGIRGRSDGTTIAGGTANVDVHPTAEGPFPIPGPGAELNREGEEQEDTIFGVDYRSTFCSS